MSGDALRKHAVELRGQAASLPTRAAEVVVKATTDTEADAKRNVVAMKAVDTGNLLNSITSAYTNGRLRGAVVATASYAFWVEGGRTGVQPRPFMGNATKRNAPLFREAMSRLGEG